MDITETLYVATREEWRGWLEANYDEKSEIWLVYYRKATGRPRISYNAAVEEALCFGWIDSIQKSLDEDRFVQRFTPRRDGSEFSQTNKERLARLRAHGKVLASVLADIGDVAPEAYELPNDILAALKENEDAWEFFRGTSPSYQRIRIAYVDGARDRPAEFEKRLKHLIEKTAQHKQFGYGIEDYF